MAATALPQLDESARARVARDLAALLAGEVRFGRHDRMLYATDASIYQVEPIGVVVPRDRDDLVAAVRYCHENGLAMLPRGGGTSLAGQCVNRAVVLDASRHLDRIVAVDEAARTAVVEPGVVLDRLNAELAPRGLMFGPDVATSSHACLGGMIGNNSAGARSILFGRTVEQVRGLTVALADGTVLRLEEGAAGRDGRVRELTEQVAAVVLPLADEIDRRFPTIIRHVDGYNLDLVLAQLRASGDGSLDRVNLASLLCGSEGTLAVTLEAELALAAAPAARGLGIVAFADVDAALRALPPILATGPSAAASPPATPSAAATWPGCPIRPATGAARCSTSSTSATMTRRCGRAWTRWPTRSGRRACRSISTLSRWPTRGRCARRASRCCTGWLDRASRSRSSRTSRWTPPCWPISSRTSARSWSATARARRTSPTRPSAACTCGR
jgi:hypothetical protein